MFPVSKAIFLARKKGFWSYIGHKTAAAIVSYFGKGGFGCGGGGCGYGVTILTMEAAGNGGGGQVEGFRGGVQGERNGRHWNDHW